MLPLFQNLMWYSNKLTIILTMNFYKEGGWRCIRKNHEVNIPMGKMDNVIIFQFFYGVLFNAQQWKNLDHL